MNGYRDSGDSGKWATVPKAQLTESVLLSLKMERFVDVTEFGNNVVH